MSKSLIRSTLFLVLASLGACATIDTPRQGFATASAVEPSQPAAWGYATVAAPSPSEIHGYARASAPQPATWGYAELPVQHASATQASR